MNNTLFGVHKKTLGLHRFSHPKLLLLNRATWPKGLLSYYEKVSFAILLKAQNNSFS